MVKDKKDKAEQEGNSNTNDYLSLSGRSNPQRGTNTCGKVELDPGPLFSGVLAE
jgi:hypothetical protein